MASAVHLPQPESLDEWLTTVRGETAKVRGWATQEGWVVSEFEEELTESPFGTYRVPVLQIETGAGTVQFRPVGRRILGALGRFDLVAWPSLFRVMLLRLQSDNGSSTETDRWVVRTESGIDWPEAWGQEAFVHLARALARAQ